MMSSLNLCVRIFILFACLQISWFGTPITAEKCSRHLCTNNDQNMLTKCSLTLDKLCSCYSSRNQRSVDILCPYLTRHKFSAVFDKNLMQLEIACLKPTTSLPTIVRFFDEVVNVTDPKSFILRDCCKSGVTGNCMWISDSHLAELVLTDFRVFWMTPKPRIVRLNLNNNYIHNVYDKFATIFPNLEMLDLSNNFLKQVPESVFLDLKTLKVLVLRNSKIESLESDDFQDVGNMRSLDLSKNQITNLPEDLFWNNTKLSSLVISSNKLNVLHTKTFENLTELTRLDLDDNQLQSLPANLFSHQVKLQTLLLSNNRLNTLPLHFLAQTSVLSVINLSSNEFTELPTIKDVANIGCIDLSNNNITWLPQPITKAITQALDLDLSGNCIQHVGVHGFNETSSRINFTHSIPETSLITNNLNETSGIKNFFCVRCCLETSQSSVLQGVTETADLSYNQIETIDMSFLSNAVKLKLVDLDFNKIKTVNMSNLSKFYHNRTTTGNTNELHRTTVILSSNEVICDCHILPFLKFLYNQSLSPKDDRLLPFRFNVKMMFCASPPTLRRRAITTILSNNSLADKLICNITVGCPKQCRCYLAAVHEITVVNCSNANLTKFPTLEGLSGPLSLHFQHNLFDQLPTKESAAWFKIRELHLNNNALTSLENITLAQSLRVVNLQKNKLSKFTPVLESLITAGHVEITLSKNPWQCDCDLQRMKKLIITHKTVTDFKNITCNTANASHYFIYNATDESLCQVNRNAIALVQTLLISIAVFVVLCSVVAVVAYRYNTDIKVWLYKHGLCLRFVTEEDVDENKLFDAFISYSSLDEEWVAQNLVPELENGAPKYSLCLHNRNWKAGEAIFSQIFRSVEHSRRTIIVLTDNFLDSHWSCLEFQAGYLQALADKVNRILIVVPTEVPKEEKLGRELSAFLQMNSYIKWNNPYFWRMLRRVMPRVKKQAIIKEENGGKYHPHFVLT